MLGKNMKDYFKRYNIEETEDNIRKHINNGDLEFTEATVKDTIAFMKNSRGNKFTGVIRYFSDLFGVDEKTFLKVCYEYRKTKRNKAKEFENTIYSIVGDRSLSIEEKLYKLREVKAITDDERRLKSTEVQKIISVIEMKFKTDLYSISKSDLPLERKLKEINQMKTITHRSMELKEKELKDVRKGKVRRVNLDKLLEFNNKFDELLLAVNLNNKLPSIDINSFK